jgi:hypothetical protein
MSGGRPRTSIGVYGEIYVMTRRGRCVAETRIRDADGRLRKVTATAGSQRAATARLKERLLERPSRGVNGALSSSTPFPALAQLWLADLDRRDLTETTKHGYRDHLRLHVGPALEHFTLGEITTGRVEWFLKSQAAVSTSMARRSRTLLNLLFGFALRHDAVGRNPVEGHLSAAVAQAFPPGAHPGPGRSAPPPRPGVRSRAFPAPRATATSATSSRSCSAPRCGPERRWRCVPATSPTANAGWSRT